MKILAMFLTLAVFAGVASAQFPDPTSQLQQKLVKPGDKSPSGPVVIINGVQKTLAPGEQPQLNPGDKVSVVSGNVTFIAPGGDKINANGAGAGFSITGNDAALQISYTGGSVSVTDAKNHTDNLSSVNSVAALAISDTAAIIGGQIVWSKYVGVSVPNVEQQKCLSGSTPSATGC